ncbi:MAG: M3 family oligoendopeptidase [Saprospiraceae bacterium]|nr:M3 family oligoendopeptidase [Saprospiraceae bacterium]
MKFSEYTYERPSVKTFIEAFEIELSNFKNAKNYLEQKSAILSINELRSDFDSMGSLASVRHSINTKDNYYEEENNFFDDNYPELTSYINDYYRALLISPYRTELETEFGRQLFVIAELRLKSFEPEIIEDLKVENKLDSQYRKIKAQAIIEYDGKEYNLSSISPLELSKNRTIRKGAAEAKWAFFEKNTEEIESIYDKMVQKRHKMATALGYKNYIELGYARMLRSDYNYQMVANFREQVKEHIVPIASNLLNRQAKRLGLDSLKYYDEGFKFPSGNPTPKGNPIWLQNQASIMYAQLSSETDDFFRFMTEKELMDLVAKDGKQTGGYCTFLNKYKSPFIFSNFNGTAHDITVLTHEAGHAFQCYSTSKKTTLYDYIWPTYEACEIHSMSMEFFTWPWMDLFFKEDTEKFKFSHLTGSILFLPYGVAIDEFQHIVYENPGMTPNERNAAWAAIEEKYLPERDYENNTYLKEGRFWQRQSHVFGMPFYYIDYVLAQICAFQFWKRSLEDKNSAWKDYIKLCNAGGTKSFLELVKLANLQSPFENGCIAEVVQPIQAYLKTVDDSKF